MDGDVMSASKAEALLKSAFHDCKDVRIARYVESHDINTDEGKVRIEVTMTLPRTAKTE